MKTQKFYFAKIHKGTGKKTSGIEIFSGSKKQFEKRLNELNTDDDGNDLDNGFEWIETDGGGYTKKIKL